MLPQEKCLELIKKLMPTTPIQEFQSSTLQKIANDLGMKNKKRKEDILAAFPFYFYRYLQQKQIAQFIPQNEDLQEDIEIPNIANVNEENNDAHRQFKEQKEIKKREILLDQQAFVQPMMNVQQLKNNIQQQFAPSPLQNYQQQIFQFQNPQFLIVNPVTDQLQQPQQQNTPQPFIFDTRMSQPPVPPQTIYLPVSQIPQAVQVTQAVTPQTQMLQPLNSTIQICSRCNQQKPLPFQRFTNQVSYCQTCILIIMNPLNEVIEPLKEVQFITKDGKLENQIINIDFKVTQAQIQNTILEIRCVLPTQLQEITFPHNCSIKLNEKEIKHCKPLQIKSCLHKRKDNPILVKLKDPINKITIQQLKMENQHRYDDPGTKYLVGLFLVRELRPEQLVQKIIDQQKNYTLDYFQEKIRIYQKYNNEKQLFVRNRIQMVNEDIQISKLQVSILCQLDFQIMTTPARGKYCNHIQCFGLENYLKLLNSTDHKKYKCIVCKVPCFELEIDKFQLTIIEKIRQKNLPVNELIFDNEGKLDMEQQIMDQLQDLTHLDGHQINKLKKKIQLEIQSRVLQKLIEE